MEEPLGVACVYAGLLLAALGLACLPRPPRRLGIASRRRAAALALAGALLVGAGFRLPAPETRVDHATTRLDDFVPAFQFVERHDLHVAATPARAYRALREVTAEEIALFRTLTWIRRLGRPGPESILNAPAKQPLLDVALRTSFLLLAEEPGREIVLGTLVAAPPGYWPAADPTPDAFRLLSRPGFAKAAINFRVVPEGDGSRLTTETRVFATDAGSRARFAAYWRVIYPGSALIRRMWLRAVARRAEDVSGS